MAIFEDGQMKLCVFGTGDIWVSAAKETDELPFENGIALSNVGYEQPINVELKHEPGIPLSELDCHVLMIFRKIESIDVIIERLKYVKQQMLEGLQLE